MFEWFRRRNESVAKPEAGEAPTPECSSEQAGATQPVRSRPAAQRAVDNYSSQEHEQWVQQFAWPETVEALADTISRLLQGKVERVPDHVTASHWGLMLAMARLKPLRDILKRECLVQCDTKALQRISSWPNERKSHASWQTIDDRGHDDETIVWSCFDVKRLVNAELVRRGASQEQSSNSIERAKRPLKQGRNCPHCRRRVLPRATYCEHCEKGGIKRIRCECGARLSPGKLICHQCKTDHALVVDS